MIVVYTTSGKYVVETYRCNPNMHHRNGHLVVSNWIVPGTVDPNDE